MKKHHSDLAAPKIPPTPFAVATTDPQVALTTTILDDLKQQPIKPQQQQQQQQQQSQPLLQQPISIITASKPSESIMNKAVTAGGSGLASAPQITLDSKKIEPQQQQQQQQQPKRQKLLAKNLFDTIGPPNRTITNTDSSSIFGHGQVIIQDPSFHLIAGDVPLTSSIVVRATTSSRGGGGRGGKSVAAATSGGVISTMSALDLPVAVSGAVDGPSAGSDLNPELALVSSCALVEGKSPLEEINLRTN